MIKFDLHHDEQRLLNLSEMDLTKLSDDEKWRLEHQKMHEKHKGHEAMHAEMIFIFIATLVVAQFLLFEWKKRYFKSYQATTLIGMWLIPVVVSIKLHWWRFLIIWMLLTFSTSFICFKATRHPIAGTTPRLVYKWFLILYYISYGLGIFGYILIFSTLFGFTHIFAIKPHVTMDIALIVIFYGLYIGVVGRDFAEVCSDKMVSKIGYYSEKGLPSRQLDPNVCAVCGNPTFQKDSNNDAVIESTYKLNCEHIFHEFCIRGWCIVGKKQTCPYCKEKVDLKRMFPSPWEKPHLLYGNLLDFVRYLITWQPIIILLVQGINWIIGLE